MVVMVVMVVMVPVKMTSMVAGVQKGETVEVAAKQLVCRYSFYVLGTPMACTRMP